MTTPAHGTNANWWEHRQQGADLTIGTTEDGALVYPQRVNPSTERAPQTYEGKIARNTRRRGSTQASEGLAARDGRVASNFKDGFAVARAQQPGFQYVEAKWADGRSRLADGSDSGNPTWASANDPVINFDFAYSHGEDVNPQRNVIPALGERSTPATHTDLSRLDLTERGRTSYGKVIVSDLKQARPNEAEVRN